MVPGRAAEVTSQELNELQMQNRDLQQQVQKQQQQIDELRQRLDALQKPGGHAEPDQTPRTPEPAAPPLEIPVLQAARAIHLSGEVGLAFFSSGPEGAYPNSEFRVDDAKIFLEAPVWQNVYLFTEMDLTTREASDEYFHVGELYADMEEVLAAGRHQTLSVRVGRFYLPFGEEYQYRSVLTNPLITHSVADIWGVDEGVEIYGSLGPAQYNLAVQNGGHKTLRDFNKDKSVTARLGFDPVQSLHLSASAHRTGKLDAVNDLLSEVWFGGGFFRALGPAATTRTFDASLLEVDAAWQWRLGHLRASGGIARFDDDSTTADNARRFSFYSLEAAQQIVDKLTGAVRYSEIRVPRGYPLVGLGNPGEYFYSPFAPLTTDLRRISAGLSYQFGPPFVWKLEYSWENGRLVSGAGRDDENMFSTEIGLKF